jgi:two-component system, OmpR family, response regulator
VTGEPWRTDRESRVRLDESALICRGGTLRPGVFTGRMRVLVVEDEPDLAAAVATGLRGEGFDVDVAHDGLDGLWRAREFDYALVVLDILMPGMNGYQVCRTLRAEGSSVPILMLTAKAGEWDEAEAFDTGADDFLAKPFSFVVLVARVRALLRRSRPSGPATLCIGTLELDPLRRTCRRGDVSISLTARELSLLEALMRMPGATRSRGELLDEVWGPDHLGDSNVVEVYVRYLRAKVDVPFGCKTLENIRGIGYRLMPDDRIQP